MTIPVPPAQPLSTVDVVRGFGGSRALVIGDAMLDTYLEGTATRLCKEGPVPVLQKIAEERAPGAPPTPPPTSPPLAPRSASSVSSATTARGPTCGGRSATRALTTPG